MRPDSQNKVEATLQHRPGNEDALPPAATENEAAERVECPKNVDGLTTAVLPQAVEKGVPSNSPNIDMQLAANENTCNADQRAEKM